ncbi:PAS domain-containing protein [uncultured Paracoccus sp.]|uniref:PAS domain-containing protein n=1 Tax=uncultured Paracoccus sp. TaxID=189685 RepID=UPI0026236269|nr:PAS domain-containing protein [uncultured Paracoccus sp.]
MSDDQTDSTGPGTPQSGPVIRIAGRGPVQPDRIIADLRVYWHSLRQGRAVPMRTDVEPQGIREGLDHAFILERIAPGAGRFRLAGKHLVDVMGMEVRGMPLCAVLNPSSRGRLSDVLETVFIGPQIAELTLFSEPGYGRPELRGQMLILPLKSDLGDVTRALGCLVTSGDLGRGPRRFDIVAAQVEPVIPGAKVLSPQPSRHDLAASPAPWRPPAAGDRNRTKDVPPNRPDPAETPEERRARFRVISSDRSA